MADSFIGCSIDSVPMLRTNSPVARALARVSLWPTEVKHSVGGSTPATVVNECGARLSAPSGDTVDTQAIARGISDAVNHG